MNAKSTILIASSLLIVIVTLLAIWAVKYYENETPTPTPTSDVNPKLEEPAKEPLPLIGEIGTIRSIDDNELLIETSGGVEKQVIVSPDIPIYARHVTETGSTTRVEVSLSLLSVGDSVTVVHQNDGSPTIRNTLDSITHDIDQPVLDYLAINSQAFPRVVSVDAVDVINRILQISRVDRGGNLASIPNADLADVQLAENLTIMAVDSLTRAHLSHARYETELTLADIQAGDVVALIPPQDTSSRIIDMLVVSPN